MRAMILAAGMGSRLGALSLERPKPLLPMCDIPLIRYPLALLAAAGVRDAAVNLHHLGELIAGELGDAAQGVALRYFRERDLLGTGGGLRNARAFVAADGPFLVINGKVVIDLDLRDVVAAHERSGALATLVVREVPDAARWGAVTVGGDGTVRRILGRGLAVPEGEPVRETMFTGVAVVGPEIVERLPEGPSCIVRQGYIPALEQGGRIGAFVAGGYFAEHSTPERYLAGNLALVAGRARLATAPAPLAGIHESARLGAGVRILGAVRVGAGARVGDGATLGPDAVVGAGVEVAAGVELAESVVWPGARVDRSARRVIVTAAGAYPA